MIYLLLSSRWVELSWMLTLYKLIGPSIYNFLMVCSASYRSFLKNQSINKMLEISRWMLTCNNTLNLSLVIAYIPSCVYYF